MILDEIVLHNFGPFRGRHRANLTRHSEKKTIVLIGGNPSPEEQVLKGINATNWR